MVRVGSIAVLFKGGCDRLIGLARPGVILTWDFGARELGVAMHEGCEPLDGSSVTGDQKLVNFPLWVQTLGPSR